MWGVRLIGTNRWVVRVPGHARVRDGVGSTWATPPKLTTTLFCEDIFDHVCDIEGLPKNLQDWTARQRFDANPQKYLEVVQVEFKEVP